MAGSTRSIGINIFGKDFSGPAFKKAGASLAQLTKQTATSTGQLVKNSGLLEGAFKAVGTAIVSLGGAGMSGGTSLILLALGAIPITIKALTGLASVVGKLAGSLGGSLLKAGANLIQMFAQLAASALKLTLSLVKLAVEGIAAAVTGLLRLGATMLKTAAIAAGALAAGIVALTGLFVASLVPAVNYAAELDKVNRGFLAIAGEGAPAMLDSLRKASAGMMTDLKLMQSYNDMVMLVNLEVGERLPEALTYLRKISAATGTDLEYMYNSLARGVGRLAPRIIDNLKIIVSLDEATARAADMFGIEEEAVSKAQKQIGMFNVVMDRLKERTKDLPDVLGTMAQKTAAISVAFKNAQGVVGTLFLPAAKSLLDVGLSLAGAFTRLISKGGALRNIFMHVSATVSVLADGFKTMIDKALPEVEKGLSSLADRFISFAWSAIEWGANISTNLAIGLARGAAAALTVAINYISNILSYWMAPGSAPRFLPDLYQWGVGAFTEWLKGFSTADFSALEAVQAPLKSALKVLLGLGEITEEQVGARFVHASEAMVRALDQFIETGTYSHSVFEELAEAGGQFGDELADLFRKQIALAGGVKQVAAAESRLAAARRAEEQAGEQLVELAHEYNKAFRRGAGARELAQRYAAVRAGYQTLVNARDETEEAETQLDLAKAQLEVLRELARAQENLLQQLIAMQEARMLPADPAGADGDGDGIPGADEEFPLPGMPDLTPIEQSFEDLKDRIRAKFIELWEGIVADWEASNVGLLMERLRVTWEQSELKKWWEAFWADVDERGFRAALASLWTKLQPTIQTWLDDKYGEDSIWSRLWRATTTPPVGGEEWNWGDRLLLSLAIIWNAVQAGVGDWLAEHTGEDSLWVRLWNLLTSPILTASEFDSFGAGEDSWTLWSAHTMAAVWGWVQKSITTWLKGLTGYDSLWVRIWNKLTKPVPNLAEFGDYNAEETWLTVLNSLRIKLLAALGKVAQEWGRTFGTWVLEAILGGTASSFAGASDADLLGLIQGFGLFINTLAGLVWTPLWNFGVGMFVAILDGLESKILGTNPDTIASWNNFWQGLIDKVRSIFRATSPSAVMSEIAGDVVQGFLDGLWADSSSVWQTGQDLAQKALDGVTDKLSAERLRGIGWSFVNHIKEGIGSISLWNAALRAGEAALDAIKRGLGFVSSNPFAEGLGRGLIEYVVRGIDSQEAQPQLALNRAVGGLSFAAPPAPTGVGLGFAGAPVGTTVVYQVTNQFGTDSVRSDADIYQIAEQIQRSLNLRGVRREPL